jgi:hypothetical protein
VTTGLSSQPPAAADPRKRRILVWAVFLGLSLLTACSPAATVHDTSATTSTGTKAAIQAWSISGGQDRTSAVSRDLARVAATAAAADITGVRAACASLQTHVETAQAYASIPDTVAQSHWSAALTQAARAAADCIAFTRNLDPVLLTRSGHELKAYDAEIGKLSERVDSLNLIQG